MALYVRAVVAAVLAVAVVAGFDVAAAAGEVVPPAQAVADDGVFLEHAPPPQQPAAVCIVDSGVDLNPDTAGEVVYREALDGGDPGDVSPDKHGTLMAMMAAAPVNGWGMVGAAPGAVKIVSVRVEEAGENSFPFSRFQRGITECQAHASAFNVRVVSLSLTDSAPPQGDDQSMLENAVDSARAYGLDVVAAVGNASQAVGPPASYRPIVAVGASDAHGALCGFSNRGPEVDMSAPGCDLDAADRRTGAATSGLENGTSESTAIASAILADVRSQRPDLSVSAAEGLFTTSGVPTLDVSGLFRAARLQTDPGTSSLRPEYEAASPRPRFVVQVHGRTAHVQLVNEERGWRIKAIVLGVRAGEFGVRKRLMTTIWQASSARNVRLPVGAREVMLTILSREGQAISSSTRIGLSHRNSS